MFDLEKLAANAKRNKKKSAAILAAFSAALAAALWLGVDPDIVIEMARFFGVEV